jgi:hypothetical protein
LIIESGSPEYYCLAELRKEYKWQLATVDWKTATDIFNQHVRDIKYNSNAAAATPKDPRAIKAALTSFEKQVRERLASKNFVCAFTIMPFFLHSVFSLIIIFILSCPFREGRLLEGALFCGQTH